MMTKGALRGPGTRQPTVSIFHASFTMASEPRQLGIQALGFRHHGEGAEAGVKAEAELLVPLRLVRVHPRHQHS